MPPISNDILGPAAGVLTSLLWAFTALFFASAARRIGATQVNALRILIAICLHGATSLLLFGSLWPEMTSQQALFLALSGILGLAICDQLLFTALVDVGPRLALLMMTTAPIIALGLGAAFLGEQIGLYALLGIAMTLGGIVWVVLERPSTPRDEQSHPHFARGIALALLASACQAGGMLLSKKGMGHGLGDDVPHIAPQAATLVRMVFGFAGMIPILAIYAWRRNGPAHALNRSRRIGRRQTGYALTLCGAIVGPFLGVWMCLVALDKTPLLGVAQTLVSLSPVLILPLSVTVLKERVSPRAVIGAVIAVAGAAVLFIA